MGSRDIWRAGGPNPDRGKLRCPHCKKKFPLFEVNSHIDNYPRNPKLRQEMPSAIT